MITLKAKIDGHIKKTLENAPPPQTKTCSNCLKKRNCPIKGARLKKNFFYYAKIKNVKKHKNGKMSRSGLLVPFS